MGRLNTVEVRLINRHPAASFREVARFKNVKREEAIRLLAGAQLLLFQTTSMWTYELHTPAGWREFGPNGKASVRAQLDRLADRWHPLDDLKK